MARFGGQIPRVMKEPSLCHRRVPSSHETMRSRPKVVQRLAWLVALMLLVAACGPIETEGIDESLAFDTLSPRPIEIALEPIATESPTRVPSTPTETPEPPTPSHRPPCPQRRLKHPSHRLPVRPAYPQRRRKHPSHRLPVRPAYPQRRRKHPRSRSSRLL